MGAYCGLSLFLFKVNYLGWDRITYLRLLMDLNELYFTFFNGTGRNLLNSSTLMFLGDSGGGGRSSVCSLYYRDNLNNSDSPSWD